MVRLVRAVVLTVREEPYVEAAIAAGTRLPLMLIRHVLPNCVPALIVQGTLRLRLRDADRGDPVASSAPASPPEIPSWGNMMAEGRGLFRLVSAHHPVPRHLPRADRARRQRAGRRTARPARSEARTARVGHGPQARPRGAGPHRPPPRRRGPRQRGRERVVRGGAGRDRLRGRRIRLRQVRDRARHHGAVAAEPARPSPADARCSTATTC